MAKNVSVTLPSWHDGQKMVWENRRKRNFICAHRGWWKTTFCMTLCVEQLLKGNSSRWYAPTMRPIRDAIDEHFKKALPESLAPEHKTEQTIKMNGAAVSFYSLEADEHSRGPQSTLAIGDEWGLVKDGIYESVVDPVLMKSDGDGWFFGTYNDHDPFNHFWQMINTVAPTRPDYIQAHTIPVCARVNDQGELEPFDSPFCNANITYEQLENSYYTAFNKTRWRIEWTCEALSLDGAVFTNIYEACVLPQKTPNIDQSKHYILAADIGKVNDYTVIIGMDVETGVMVYMDRFTDCSWEQIYSRLRKASATFGGLPIKVDATGAGSHIYEAMMQYGVHIIEHKWNVVNKPKLIDHLASLLERKQLKLWQSPAIINELKAFNQSTVAGRVKYTTAEHDDVIMTLAMAAEPIQVKSGDKDQGTDLLDKLIGYNQKAKGDWLEQLW